MAAKKEVKPAKSSGVKENEQSPNAVAPVHAPKVNISVELPQADDDLELQKARGQTESQKQMKAFHEGRFQSHDPVSGQKRDKHDSVNE